MKYSFQLLPHPNARYREANIRLGAKELVCMLSSLGIRTAVEHTEIGNSDFLTFECDCLTEEQTAILARHSSLLLMAESVGECLCPLQVVRPDYLPRELSEILKYKGKTSVSFTRMMINTALAAAGCLQKAQPLVLDPMCGKGTTLFCAAEMGLNACGVDVDHTDLLDAINHFAYYCKHAGLKHTLTQRSQTTPKGPVPTAAYVYADSKEHYKQGNTRSLTFCQGDTAAAGALLKKTPADILIADLPYGIQHAPQSGVRPEGFAQLMARALPEWKKALRKGGALCISFNELTFKREQLVQLLTAVGFEVMAEEPYGSCPHFVEQAVTRDFITARL